MAMATLLFVTLLITILSLAVADIKVSDYVSWKKADITAWHQYFPSRALQEENLTNIGAVNAAQSVEQGLEESLRRVAWYQAQELSTAQLMMEGTSAQGCVEGISTFMTKAIDNEVSSYQDCAADVIPRLRRAAANLTRITTNYQNAYHRALTGIDSCVRTYPNKDSLSRLKTCVEAWNKNYFTVANNTRSYNAFVSPAMTTFTTAAECAQTAAKNVVAKGWEFLQKLVHCAKLSENIDAQAYEEQVSTGYSNYLTQNDLTSQVQLAQALNSQQVSQIEEKMLFYYDLQKRALESYVIESRGSGHYLSQVVGYLSGYYSTIAATSSDNPGEVHCSTSAYSALSAVANTGSSAALACDRNIVEDTKYRLSKVNNEFAAVNSLLPATGNVAILSCFSEGYIFAEKTILNCYKVASSHFSVNYKDVYDSVVKDVATLLGYESSFFGNNSLPCGDSVLRRAYSEAEKVLYDLQRCLYKDSGTKYAVTTPAPVPS
ncbi:uncharacterized protein LOC124353843 isoform X2 [Homalodisca vitripennis]|uniref:uncharacterized protein LOC124353843 isoform X2 n=1 Tax=Homalodisca vitripennis TaxID=197043 RepID=UPI001EEC081D|nr:uncharacterized protein LOC124353843 isoform X2 [Homalodisca vitripennis]